MSLEQNAKKASWKRRMRAEILASPMSRVYRFSFRPRGKLDLTFRNPQVADIARKDLRAWYLRLKRKFPDLRYCAVPEFGGKGGRIHFHVLVHGDVPSTAVRKAWKQGQTHVKNVEIGRMAAYLAKYIGKDLDQTTGKGMRVRCNQRYGDGVPAAEQALRDPLVSAIYRQFPNAEAPKVMVGPYQARLVEEEKFRPLVPFSPIHPEDRAEMKCGEFRPTRSVYLENLKRDRMLDARARAGNYD